jgi:hypothetical protein
MGTTKGQDNYRQVRYNRNRSLSTCRSKFAQIDAHILHQTASIRVDLLHSRNTLKSLLHNATILGMDQQ